MSIFIIPKISIPRYYTYCQDCEDCKDCGSSLHRICTICIKNICCLCMCKENNLNNKYAISLVPYLKTLTDVIISNENFDIIEKIIKELDNVSINDISKIKQIVKENGLIKKYNFSSIFNI